MVGAFSLPSKTLVTFQSSRMGGRVSGPAWKILPTAPSPSTCGAPHLSLVVILWSQFLTALSKGGFPWPLSQTFVSLLHLAQFTYFLGPCLHTPKLPTLAPWTIPFMTEGISLTFFLGPTVCQDPCQGPGPSPPAPPCHHRAFCIGEYSSKARDEEEHGKHFPGESRRSSGERLRNLQLTSQARDQQRGMFSHPDFWELEFCFCSFFF